jgi:AraC family transcriptional regulator
VSEHQFRINKAVNFIEDHLFEELSLEVIAQRAALSPYHFHRIFSALVESTVAQYVRQRRLTECLAELHDQRTRIIDLAVKCGFESQGAFTRAFKDLFGITPGQYQKLESGKPGVQRISDADVAQATSGHIVAPEIVARPATRVIGLATAISGMSFPAVYALWATYSKESAKHFDAPDADSIGVSCRSHPNVQTRPGEYVYIAAHAVTSDCGVPPGFIELSVPGGTYARFTHKGHVSTLQATIKKIWRSWLWHAGLTPANGPDLEVYAAGRFRLESNDSEVDIYIPIERMNSQ